MSRFWDKISSLRVDVSDVTPEYIEWMWDVKELTPFLEWFIKYIDESNCVDSRQLSLFQDLRNDGKELEGDELDQALQNYGINVSDYLSSDLLDSDLDIYDQELSELRAHDEHAAKLQSQLIWESQKAVTMEEIMEETLKSVQANCQKEGQNLMKINAPLKAIISTSFSNFSKLITALKDSDDPDILNNCICNMSLESALLTCTKFNESANLCLRRKFQPHSFSERHAVSELMPFLEEESSMRSGPSSFSSVTDGLPNKMWKAGVTKIDLQGSLSGLISAIQHLEMLQKSDPTLEALDAVTLKLEAGNLRSDILRLSENIDLLMKHEVGNLAEDVVLLNILNVVINISQTRIQRRQMLLQELCSVNTIVCDFLYLTDIMWMIITIESQRFKLGTEILKEVSDFHIEELERHDATMCGLKKISNGFSLRADTLRTGEAQFLDIIQRLSDCTVSDGDFGNETSTENQQKELENAQLCNVLESLEKLHSARETSIYELILELVNGSTKKPTVVNTTISLAIQEAANKLESCQHEMNTLTSQFSAKQLAFKKFPVTKTRRLLWAWFLVAPEKLREAFSLAAQASQK